MILTKRGLFHILRYKKNALKVHDISLRKVQCNVPMSTELMYFQQIMSSINKRSVVFLVLTVVKEIDVQQGS